MELVFAYLAGLLTLINPCILPVLPVVLASALQESRHGPAALAAGMSLSFVTLGLTVTAAGHALGLDEATVIRAGAFLMLAFGLVLLTPALGRQFAFATSGGAARADAGFDRLRGAGAGGQFLGGALLGAVWSPCIGPTLGAAIGLASQGGSLLRSGAVMVAFALGVASVILALAHGARGLFARNRALLAAIARWSRPVMGATFVLVALAVLAGFDRIAEGWAARNLPIWLQDLSVTL